MHVIFFYISLLLICFGGRICLLFPFILDYLTEVREPVMQSKKRVLPEFAKKDISERKTYSCCVPCNQQYSEKMNIQVYVLNAEMFTLHTCMAQFMCSQFSVHLLVTLKNVLMLFNIYLVIG